jgi:hypothetical protein
MFFKIILGVVCLIIFGAVFWVEAFPGQFKNDPQPDIEGHCGLIRKGGG